MSVSDTESRLGAAGGFRQTFSKWSGIVLPFVVGLLVLLVLVGIVLTLQEFPRPDVSQEDLIVYVVSWVILLLISFAATTQIRGIIRSRAHDSLRRNADQIAVIIGLVLLVFLFKQPYLDQLFGGTGTNFWIRVLLLGGGGATGWVVWYLRQLATYGEFFHVLLMTLVAGFCWYARLTAPEEIQLTTVAFLLGSLFRLAKDYMDEAARSSPDKA